MDRPSEQSISAAFKDALSSNVFRFQRQQPNYFVDEFDGVAGRADFVLSPTQLKSMSEEQIVRFVKGVSSLSSAFLISILIQENLDEESLIDRIGLSKNTIRRFLRQLESNGVVEKGDCDTYGLSSSFIIPSLELWAIELKVDNWKKALYQSLQYQSFSHRTIVVVPMVFAHRITSQLERFRSFNVGVIGIDENGSMRTLIKAERQKPSCDHYYLYAMSVFLRRLHPELRV